MMEQHAQTIISTIIAGLIAWGGWSLSQLQQDFASTKTEIANLKVEVRNLRDIQDRDLKELRSRVRNLEIQYYENRRD